MSLLGIRFPIIQGGMVWCTGADLVTAVGKSGGLGVLGAGSMYPDELRSQMHQVKANLNGAPYAVNIPLLYNHAEEHVKSVISEKCPIVITSAGSPATYTQRLKAAGCIVLHVVSSSRFAEKAEKAGVDAVIAEGFEAGGHNGREETTTMCLVPAVVKAVSVPVVAAGGIGTGHSMVAAMALGADGVQMGTRFLMSQESAAHPKYKELLVGAKEGDTTLTLKELAPVRLLKNHFYDQVAKAYEQNAKVEQLRDLLGKGRARKGMSEGDLFNGELEVGQISALINDLPTVERIFANLQQEWCSAIDRLSQEHK